MLHENFLGTEGTLGSAVRAAAVPQRHLLDPNAWKPNHPGLLDEGQATVPLPKEPKSPGRCQYCPTPGPEPGRQEPRGPCWLRSHGAQNTSMA